MGVVNSSRLMAALAGGVALSVSATGLADDAKTGWVVSAELAWLLNRGNTNSDKINAKANGKHENASWRQTAKLESGTERAKAAADNGYTRSAERYFGSYKLDWKFSNDNYLFNVATAEKDNFAGYDYELSYALGYGRKLINSKTHELDVEIGPGYRYRRFEASQVAAGEERTDDNAIVRVALGYRWAITETSEFSEKVTTQHESDLTTTRAETALTSQINGSLSTRISHVLRYSSEVSAGVEHADHEMTVGIVYTF